MKLTKIIPMCFGFFFLFIILMFPSFSAGTVIYDPFSSLNQIVQDIGEWTIGDWNEAVDIIDAWLTLDESQMLINEQYLLVIRKDEDIDIPLSYLLIPNLIGGLEEPSSEQFQFMVSQMKIEYVVKVEKTDANGEVVKDEEGNVIYVEETRYKIEKENEYIRKIRSSEPWESAFSDISNESIAAYITSFKKLDIYGGLEQEFIAQYGDDMFIYPFRRRANITAGFGLYSPFGAVKFHDAVDLAFPKPNNCGEPIYSISDGVVAGHQGSNWQSTGNYAVIRINEFTIKYYHMAENFSQSVGTQIKKGDFIGTVGSTGQSTGCHLHLEIEVNGTSVNPELYIELRNPSIP